MLNASVISIEIFCVPQVAAQNCRQRKIEQIEELHGKLSKAMARRDRVRYEHQK